MLQSQPNIRPELPLVARPLSKGTISIPLTPHLVQNSSGGGTQNINYHGRKYGVSLQERMGN
jgi:hypothetical protein